MSKVYKFKLNLKESEIPKFIKLPNYVLPQFPLKEKPNILLTPKIDFKKAEFLFLVKKDKGGYFFTRIDPYPSNWSGTNQFLLLEENKKEDGYYEYETSGLHVKNLPFSYYRIAFNEEHKILINHIGYYAGKTRDKLKYYDKTFLTFNLISIDDFIDMFETLPEDVKSGLTETNLNEALSILSKKPKKSKQFFSRRAFAYQNIFYSYEQYNLIILANNLHELKYDLFNSEDAYMYKKYFFQFIEQFNKLYTHIKKVDTIESAADIFAKLSFDEDRSKIEKNFDFYMKIFDEYRQANQKKN